jgi:hypothetical protein
VSQRTQPELLMLGVYFYTTAGRDIVPAGCRKARLPRSTRYWLGCGGVYRGLFRT